MASVPYTPEIFAERCRQHKEQQRQAREARKQRWGFPANFQDILALLDCLPTRDELAADSVSPAVPQKEPRRKGKPALHGEAARRRNVRLTRAYYARLTPEQRAERNRKRRARYKETRAAETARADSNV